MLAQLPTELPEPVLVAVQLVCRGVVAPRAGEERTLELKGADYDRAEVPKVG